MAATIAVSAVCASTSFAAGGIKGNGDSAGPWSPSWLTIGAPSLSADGRFVAFASTATNLSPDDTDANVDVFVRDIRTGNTVLASRATGPAGAKANAFSAMPAISGDGRYVAFFSGASNLSPDSAIHSDIYVRDLEAATTTLVSRAPGGSGPAGNQGSDHPTISADGHSVSFISFATNLSPGDPTTDPDVYVRDLISGTTTLANRATGAGGAKGSVVSFGSGLISDGGGHVVFTTSYRLDPDDIDDAGDVYVRDLDANTTTLVSRMTGATGGSNGGSPPSAVHAGAAGISADGRLVVFGSSGPLDPADTDCSTREYVRDLQTQTTTCLSLASGGTEPNGSTGITGISADATKLLLRSTATNLDPADTSSDVDLYLHDREQGTSVLVTRAGNAAGTKANSEADYFGISPLGNRVAFSTGATNLNIEDSDFLSDVYVRHVASGTTSLESRATAGYPRPKAATPMSLPLVPAYDACASPNRMHAVPLSYGSCSPPGASSAQLTLGTPDANGQQAQGTGFVRLRTIAGDAAIEVAATDVRRAADLADYTGELRLRAELRATDRSSPRNAGETPGPATVADVVFGPSVPCSPTGTAAGSTCSISTTVNTLIPGAVAAGARSNWELGTTVVDDGGPDGDGDTASDNSPFLTQGIFVP